MCSDVGHGGSHNRDWEVGRMSHGIWNLCTFSSTYVPMPMFVIGPMRPAAESRIICDTHPNGKFQACSFPARISGRNSGLRPYLRRRGALSVPVWHQVSASKDMLKMDIHTRRPRAA